MVTGHFHCLIKFNLGCLTVHRFPLVTCRLRKVLREWCVLAESAAKRKDIMQLLPPLLCLQPYDTKSIILAIKPTSSPQAGC